jgi:8-hydroxy-5-deazaflavin:NADPH oxidoreductase
MNIGIIGAGTVGLTLSRLWVTAGHQVFLSFSRSDDRLRDKAEQVGQSTLFGSPAQAVEFADVVIFSPNFWMAEEALRQTAKLTGKIVIDTTNPVRWSNIESTSGGLVRMVSTETSGAAWLLENAENTKGARWVKAFSTLQPNALVASAKRNKSDWVAVPFATDDASSRPIVSQLIVDAGGLPFDAGSLQNAGLLEIGGVLAMSNDLTLNAAAQRLQSAT